VLLDLVDGLTQANWYVEVLDGYDIPDDEEAAAAKVLALAVAKELKKWEEQRELATRALKTEYDTRRAFFNPVLQRLEQAKKSLKGLIGNYALHKVQEQQRLFAAAAAAATPTESMQLMKAGRVMVSPDVKGTSTKVFWVAELVDETLVPEEYRRYFIDMDAVQAAVDAGARSIDGIEIKQKASTTLRS
jgi:hypothetical protein